MRISDWSSDVCSSDLAARRLHRHPSSGNAHVPGSSRCLGAHSPTRASDADAGGACQHSWRPTFDDCSRLLCTSAQRADPQPRSEEHTSELQSLMRISYAVFCLKKKMSREHTKYTTHTYYQQISPHTTY